MSSWRNARIEGRLEGMRGLCMTEILFFLPRAETATDLNAH
jgi:hypothetical protein